MTRLLLAVVSCLALTACSGGAGGASQDGATLTVLAASSLAGPVGQVARAFERSHPGSHVTVTTGGSSELVTQLADGLHADVLLTADEATMRSAHASGVVDGTPARIATNTLTLLTAPGNPLHLTSIADAGAHHLVVCAPQVPCGAATVRLARAEGASVHAVSEEPNVTSVLEKVTSGQADAGVVYVTDARRAGSKATAVPLAGARGVVNGVMLARVRGAGAGADALVRSFTGSTGTDALRAAGFGRP